MLFNYKAINEKGDVTDGSIDAVSQDVAISALQRRGLIISSIDEVKDKSIWDIRLFDRVSSREVAILSRQISTLFEAQVAALRVFRLLGAESINPALTKALTNIADDLQGGSNIASALSKHPHVFSTFYTNMVRAGEESGNLDSTFNNLADHLERTQEVTSKARNALIYPAFVVLTFVTVMGLMFSVVIPRVSEILEEVGSEIPLITKIVIGLSTFVVDFGAFVLLLVAIGGVLLWRYGRTEKGAIALSEFKLSVPYIGSLYRKIYLHRVADNLSTMLGSGITMVRALEVTASVVGDPVYEQHLLEAVSDVKAGRPLSEALSKYPEFPGIIIQMIKVGEETGELGSILGTLARFYRREVSNSIDTLVNLIEPIMIVALGLSVGFLLSAVLLPIYSISSAL